MLLQGDPNFSHSALSSLQYVFVVMAVLVLEAGVGALARLYEEQVGPELKMNLNRTFLENYSVRSRETAAIDQMQKEVRSVRAIGRNFSSIFQTRGGYARARASVCCARNETVRRAIAGKMERASISRARRALGISFPVPVVIFMFPDPAVYFLRDSHKLSLGTSMVLHAAARNTQHATPASSVC